MNSGKRYLGVCCLLVGLVQAIAQPGPAVTPAQQYAFNRAAVVMVKTEVSASVYVRQITIDNSAFNKLLDSIQQLEIDSLFLTPGQKLDIVLRAFNTRASHYFKSTLNYYRHQQKVSATGSGFIFTPDGYIFTNCHVVSENDDYIRRRFILSAFTYVTERNFTAIESAWAVKFSEDQRNSLYKTFADMYSRLVPIVLENLQKNVFVLLSQENESGEAVMKSTPAIIVQKGRSMPGKDVAILKINADTQLSTIKLSKSDMEAVGDEVYVYGFPNPVTNNEYLSKQSALEPTLTRGIVSAWKETVENWPVMQMDAGINHGNSGGPVCNNKGEVIGLTTFGTLDDNSKSLAPGLNFAIPMLVLKEFLNDSLLKSPRSKVASMFAEGVMMFDKAFYRRALRLFRAAKNLNPAYPGVRKYISLCEQRINNGEDKDVSVFNYIGILLAVILLAGLFFYNRRRKRYLTGPADY